MKFFYSALIALPALAAAKVLLAVGPSSPLAIGETYDVEWLVDTKMVRIYSLDLEAGADVTDS